MIPLTLEIAKKLKPGDKLKHEGKTGKIWFSVVAGWRICDNGDVNILWEPPYKGELSLTEHHFRKSGVSRNRCWLLTDTAE